MMQRQSRQLLSLTKQLSTPHLPQLVLALSQCNTLLHTMQSVDCFNTLVITLLDLFNTCKYSYAKDKICRMLIMCKCININMGVQRIASNNSNSARYTHVNVYQLPTKQQIVSMIMQALNSNDTVVYILALQIVQAWTALFQKDTALLIYLFAQLDKFQKCLNKSKQKQGNKVKPVHMIPKQYIKTVQCLNSLLQHSEYLSTTLHSTLKQLSTMGNIQLHILLYLCSKAKFMCGTYRKVIVQLWNMMAVIRDNIQDNNKKNINMKKKRACYYYFGKLLYRACLHDYQCIGLYQKQFKNNNLFLDIAEPIQKLKRAYYTFIPNNTHNNNNIKQYELNEETLLDICYQSFEIMQSTPEWVHNQIISKFKASKQIQQLSYNIVLFTFYLPAATMTNLNMDVHLSQIFTKQCRNLKNNNICILKLLKISLVCCTYALSSAIISYILNNEPILHTAHNISVFMLCLCYVQLHIHQTRDRFQALLAVMGNLAQAGRHQMMIRLALLWKQFYQSKIQNQYQDIKQTLTNIRQYQPQSISHRSINQQQNYNQNQDNKQSVCKIPCMQQIQNLSGTNSMEMVEQKGHISRLLMPQRQHLQRYNKIYFGKQTILDIFRNL